jgi:hypothetical protein
MMIDLLNLQTNKVSTDFSGYPVVFVGATGDGKTDSLNMYLRSVSPEGKVPLFIMFEDRHRAIQNIMAQRVYSIDEVVSIVNQLKNPKVRERFSGVVIDTIDKFEEMASRYHSANKEVEIIEDLSFGKGKRYLNATIGIVSEIRNLGLPVHFTAQTYTRTDIISKKTTVETKLKDTTKAQIFHEAFLVGKVSVDPKAKDPIHSDRLITFRKSDADIDLKDTFGLPTSMYVSKIKENLEKLFESKYDKSDLTTNVVFEVIKQDDFEAIKNRGLELGGMLANEGHLEEAMSVLKVNIGQDEKGNAKMFDSLVPSQIDLAKVVVLRLEELCDKHNIKK